MINSMFKALCGAVALAALLATGPRRGAAAVDAPLGGGGAGRPEAHLRGAQLPHRRQVRPRATGRLGRWRRGRHDARVAGRQAGAHRLHRDGHAASATPRARSSTRSSSTRTTPAMRRRCSTTGMPGQAGNGFSGGALVGPGLLFDTNRFYVVFVDALGLFGASKPSDGLGRKFPVYSYYDVVHLNYRLLRDHLKVGKVVLATGVSMGATQAYYWGLMYPDFVQAVMPVGGATATDGEGQVAAWTFQLAKAALEADPVWVETNGNYYHLPKDKHPNKGVEYHWSVLSLTGYDLGHRQSQGWDAVSKEVFTWQPDPRHGQERRRQSRQPGQDLRRRRPLVPRHRRRDPQHQRAAARHEAAHAGRARRQRPVADLRQGARGGAGDPRRAVREPVEPDRALRGVQRAEHAGRRPDAQHLRARHRHRRGQDQGLRRRATTAARAST